MILFMLAQPAPVVVYPFKHRDWDGKWIQARYMAGLDQIAARYSEWEITGPPETRWPTHGWFSPWRNPPASPRFDGAPMSDPPCQLHPQRNGAIDQRERWLVCLFLERYVVWSARRRRIEQVRYALGLLTEIAGTPVRSPQ